MLEGWNNRYHLFTEWQFDAPLDVVWDAIYHAEAWPDWWKSVESVITLSRGDADGVGAQQRYTWKGVLPYRLTFVTRVTRIEHLQLLEGRVEGDLEGQGRWRFLRGQGLTTVHYEWQVRTTKLWMTALAPLARPIFRWNHDAVMRAGGVGLARYLEARLTKS